MNKNKYCKCGCKQIVNNKFVQGHNSKGKNNPMYGKHHSVKTIKKMSQSRKGKIYIARETRYCKCDCGFSKEVKINSKWKFKRGHGGIGKNNSMYGKPSPNKGKKIKPCSEKRKKINRFLAIKRIEENHGICMPGYNKKACEFFKNYDEKNNTKGHYAVYGGGEHYIKELGYWPDYINFDKKIIIEFDEKYHNKRLEKDAIRQQQIQKLYPDFEFRRMK